MLDKIFCPRCGNYKFKQEVVEIYCRYIDGNGKILEYEEDLTHDIEYGDIICEKCGADCTNLFNGVEIEY
jgi:hypothetical protein